MNGAARALQGVLVHKEDVITKPVENKTNEKEDLNSLSTQESSAKSSDITEVPVYESMPHVKLGQQVTYLAMLYSFIALATPDVILENCEEIFRMQYGSVFKEDVGAKELSEHVGKQIEYLRSIITDSLGEMLKRKPSIEVEDLCAFMDKWEVQ